jgi:hypothetical protein
VPRGEGNGADGDREVVGHWYANSFEIGHNAFQFKLDCGQDGPDSGMVTVFLRVIASPFNARELFRQLGTALLQYSDTFGPIDDKAARHQPGSGR